MCNNDSCEKKIKDALGEEELKFFLDGYIDEADDDVVVVPREEYDELIAESTILRVIEKLAASFDYDGDRVKAIRAVLEIGKPEPEPPIQSATGPDEEDAE